MASDNVRVKVWVQKFPDRPHLVLQWHDPDTGRRKSKTAGTADADKAEDQRADLESDLNHGRHQEASRMSWERFRELFDAEYVAGKRLNTRRNYKATLDLFERVCHPGSLRAVNERIVSRFAAGLRQLPGRRHGSAGMAASSIKVRLQCLHTALSWGVEQKLLPEVPKFPAVKVPSKKPQPVAAESFERLLGKAGTPDMTAYLLCGWLAGLRLNEALGLEWELSERSPYLDFAHNRIVLPAEFVKADADQWVPLDPKLREALEALPRQGAKVFRFRGRQGNVLGDVAVSHLVGNLARQAGVRLSYHTLRKGFGCRYAGRVPAQVLQKLMRHANLKTTMDYYANVDDAVVEAVMGAQRNSSRNTGHLVPSEAPAAEDVTSDPGPVSGSPPPRPPRP
jgi:integrase